MALFLSAFDRVTNSSPGVQVGSTDTTLHYLLSFFCLQLLGCMYNNASYRQYSVTGTTNFTFTPVAVTVRMTLKNE